MSSATITSGDNAKRARQAQISDSGQRCEDKDLAHRLDLAGDPNASSDALQLLASDYSVFVRITVAVNPCTPNPVLALLARDRESEVRLALARSLATNIELLRQLALDPDESVASAARRSFKIVEVELKAKNRDLSKDSNQAGSRKRIA